MPAEIKPFAGGARSQREHINQLVDTVNQQQKDLDKLMQLLNRNPVQVRARNLADDRTVVVEVDGLILRVEPAGAGDQKFFGVRNGEPAAWLIEAEDTDV